MLNMVRRNFTRGVTPTAIRCEIYNIVRVAISLVAMSRKKRSFEFCGEL